MKPEEIKRYNRHIILSEIGLLGQQKLKEAKVLVIGAGGLGCPVLQYLAAAGVGNIGIVDHDTVDVTNLQRQILYDEEDVGRPKAESAARRLTRQNPFVRIDAISTKLDPSNALSVIANYDVIVDGSDNFPTRYLVNDTCVQLNKPLVSGSVLKFEGQVTVFNYRSGPTYRCLFPEPPSDIPSCSEIGVMGVLPGIIGLLQANEVIKIITGAGDVLSGKLLMFDALSMSFRTFEFEKNADALQQVSHYEEVCSTSMKPGIKQIAPAELKERIEKREQVQIIDVREEYEYEEFNINGELIPAAEIPANMERLSREGIVVIHCQAGTRSESVIRYLQQQGLTNLYNLTGGINAWIEEVAVKNAD